METHNAIMETKNTFYTKYVSLARSADALFSRVSQMENEAPLAINDIQVFSNHLVEKLPLLNEYPLMVESLYSLMGKDGMTGYVGVFIVDQMISTCDSLRKQEKELIERIERIRDFSKTIDNGMLDDLKKMAEDWRRNVCLENIKIIVEYMDSIRMRVDEMYETFKVQEQLSQALAKSEAERRRMTDAEAARQKEITESEADKEEKRRKAREAFAKNRKTRKK
ncbi:MAG: hypothetical protein IKX20_03390 [Paludibacteraceae bacterium]|nr:hypothetical protein [Paludibacteraceae bacterium]